MPLVRPSFRLLVPLLALAVLLGITACGKKSQSAPKNEVVTITLPPPPPPPPPLPPPPQSEPPPPEEQQMVEQEQVTEEEPPPDDSPAPEEPPTDLTTGLTGDGPNNFGLSGGKPGGGTGRIGGTGGGGKGSPFSRYAARVGGSIEESLRRDPVLKKAVFRVKARVWVDANGRVTRASITTSGDPAVDAAIRSQTLGTQVSQAPAADQPQPIVMWLSAKR
jgi:periplasmic protein TonB